MQAQTEPKLHPETANMEFEQVITKRSATLKGDLKVNLEPKWFLRRFPWKFHVSDFRATLLFTSYCAHVLITIQVPGLWWGKNWNQNTSKKRSWLIFRYVLGSVFVAQPSKASRNRQKTWQWREKKQATWKDNKNQQTKKESGKSNKEQKTHVTIWWWTCWSCHGAPKVNFVGFHVGFRCEFDDHTRGTQQVGGGEPDQGEHTGRQNVATAQKRPSGTFSPLPNVKEN